MSLTTGTRLGPYEILGPLGAGGMGEVYRASDSRLRREVAIKVLPVAVSADPDRLRRFEQEALAAASLNHPNILAVYDVGTHAGAPYVVSELLSGATLGQTLRTGPLPMRRALDYAVQIAHGLAAAHGKGIVHRDVKPENVFVTREGLVKILDFGLAKLTAPDLPAGVSQEQTFAAATEPGMIVGTPAYMSPEQIRGEAVDHRSDTFSLALVLYEMVSGQRAFGGSSPIETMSAILKEDPPPISRALPTGLDRLIGRCLQKSPDQRYQSTKDLAFQLESLPAESAPGAGVSDVTPRPIGIRRVLVIAAMLVAALAGVAGGLLWNRSKGPSTEPTFKRLTFRRGTIESARFAPDGQTFVYSAAWQGERSQLFSARTDSQEARPLGLTGAAILSISSAGEMALRLTNGTLARAPLAGGAPREVAEHVTTAAWAPDGKTLAIVRLVSGRSRLEFPPGHVLYETTNILGDLSLSRKGDLIACSESAPGIGEVLPSLVVFDLAGKKQTLSEGWSSIRGLSWSPDGNEIWFAAKKSIGGRNLFAVTRDGTLRALTRVPVNLNLHDISADGRVLLERSDERLEASGLVPGETRERDLSWLDVTGLSDLSADGRTLILTEFGESGFRVFLRKTDGSPAAHLGDGGGFALSPDGRWVILQPLDPLRLALLPTGPGDIKPIAHQQFVSYLWADWFPDGKRILFVGSEPGHLNRPYVQNLDGGPARPIAAEGVTIQTGSHAISPDGQWVLLLGPDGIAALYPTNGGEPRPIPGVSLGDLPARWTLDGRTLYVFRQNTIPAPIYRLNITTGQKELWKEVGPTDTSGVTGVGHFLVTPDGTSYAYNFFRTLSDLYVVDGIR